MRPSLPTFELVREGCKVRLQIHIPFTVQALLVTGLMRLLRAPQLP